MHIWLNLQVLPADTGTIMNTKAHSKYQARARIMKAMAHPTRLLIVDELAKRGEECVCKLTEMIGADMSTVSRHLALLKGAGIIEDEKRGSMVFYRLRTRCVMDFFRCLESVIECGSESCGNDSCGNLACK